MRKYWQHIVFSVLCILVPGTFASFVRFYEDHGDLEFHTATTGCLIFGGLAACLLLGWSAWGFRHHKVRAVIGFIVCLVTFWWTFTYLQAIQYMKS